MAFRSDELYERHQDLREDPRTPFQSLRMSGLTQRFERDSELGLQAKR